VKILPVAIAGDGRTGRLSDELTPEVIAETLGFGANVSDDHDKVLYSWGFTVDGVRCGIWDYKECRWSTFGPKSIFEKLFPGKYNV
jgi:hypothetical protein